MDDFDFDLVPAVERRSFCRFVKEMVLAVFGTPEGKAKYAKWQEYMTARGGDENDPTEEEMRELDRIMKEDGTYAEKENLPWK